jgi:ubiquitin-protein ligase
MLTETRWSKEQELMQSVFPEFTPFLRDGVFGFEGCLKGRRSGLVYRVVLEADQAGYPQYPPSVSMNPRIGSFWIGAPDRRRLCMDRQWRPAKSTFANTLLAVIRYLDEFDPEPHPEFEPRGVRTADGLRAEAGRGRDRPPRLY